MKNRKDIEEDILRQMRDIKAKIKAGSNSSTVPYDKEAARTVIQKFLSHHPDKEGFMKDLIDKMDKTPDD